MLKEDMFEHACEATQDMLDWGRPRSGVPLSHPATARTHPQPRHTHTHNWVTLCTVRLPDVNYAL